MDRLNREGFFGSKRSHLAPKFPFPFHMLYEYIISPLKNSLCSHRQFIEEEINVAQDPIP